MGFFDIFKHNTQSDNVQSEEKNIDTLLKKAQNGDADAMFELGDLYEQESNYTEAEQWFLKAIEKGHPTAKYFLALNYSVSGALAKIETAVKYLSELVNEGYETYAKDLGYIYSDYAHKRCPAYNQFYDLKKAEQYYLQAIRAKSETRWVAAVHELGVLYAGKYLYEYLDDDIQNPIKAAYCLYVSSVEGEYDREDFFTVVKNANIRIPQNLYRNWEQDYREKTYTF